MTQSDITPALEQCGAERSEEAHIGQNPFSQRHLNLSLDTQPGPLMLQTQERNSDLGGGHLAFTAQFGPFLHFQFVFQSFIDNTDIVN